MGWIPWKYWNIVELPGRLECLWKVWNDWNVIGATGVAWKTHRCISRRSPCLLCVEFLELDCSTRRALCLLHVELDSGWRILWIVV